MFSVTVQKFQENLLKCMLQLENTYFELGESCDQNCLIICDRGAMDAAACNTKIIFMIFLINVLLIITNSNISVKKKIMLVLRNIVMS